MSGQGGKALLKLESQLFELKKDVSGKVYSQEKGNLILRQVEQEKQNILCPQRCIFAIDEDDIKAKIDGLLVKNIRLGITQVEMSDEERIKLQMQEAQRLIIQPVLPAASSKSISSALLENSMPVDFSLKKKQLEQEKEPLPEKWSQFILRTEETKDGRLRFGSNIHTLHAFIQKRMLGQAKEAGLDIKEISKVKETPTVYRVKYMVRVQEVKGSIWWMEREIGKAPFVRKTSIKPPDEGNCQIY